MVILVLEVEMHFIDDLKHFSMAQAEKIGNRTFAILNAKRKHAFDSNAFGLLLVDGLSVAEENVAASL